MMEYKHIFLVFAIFIVHTAAQAPFSNNCTMDSHCWVYSRHALCDKGNATVNATTTGGNTTTASPANITGACVCDSAARYLRSGQTCIYQAKLGESCITGQSVCVTAFSECRNDGTNQAMRRCLCRDTYYKVPAVNSTSEFICGTHLTYKDDANCKQCEDNEGKCVDRTGDRKRDYCACPASRSGTSCERLHVNVTCDVDTFTMRICYTPHDGFNFTSNTSTAAFYVDGKGSDKACRGVRVGANDTLCGPGQVKLVLPMKEAERHRCGTTNYYSDITTRKYDNRLVVQKEMGKSSASDISLKTYCSFVTQTDASFKGIGVKGIPGNDRGENKKPTITLRVENHFAEPIPEGVALRLGDRIRLKILLTDDGTYKAILVLRCTASSSATIPDAKAVIVPLIEKGCPTSSTVQKVFTVDNTWKRVSGRLNEVQTSLFPMFMLSHGNTVFIHCTAKLCLKGSESQCAPRTCPATASARRRRAVSDLVTQNGSTASTTRKLIVYNPGEPGTAAGFMKMPTSVFSGLLSVILTLLLTFIAITVGLIFKLRQNAKKVPDYPTVEKPQRFALPRMQRPVRF